MKSLILTSLYLFKDTFHRWKERPASVLSRMLVVFFLSLCALSFLANYILAVRMINDQIKNIGGDLISIINMEQDGSDKFVTIARENMPQLCDVDVIVFNDVPGMALVDGKYLSIFEYSAKHLDGLKELPLDKHPYLVVLSQKSKLQEAPITFSIDDFSYTMPAFRLPTNHILNRDPSFNENGVILLPEGASNVSRDKLNSRVLIAVKQMTYENVKKVHTSLENVARMDGNDRVIVRSGYYQLEELGIITGNQMQCRAGFSIGIACIVGILLTAIASMEFRQNEYVYTLMKSFGVHPLMLVFTFIAENFFLVALSFAIAVYFFLETQKIVLGQFFKFRNAFLTMEDISSDVSLLAISLSICVLVSSIPIMMSAYREIGRVLK
ncbi:MAG: hypothetical protein RR889_06645 [Akkermansia sp.]